MGFHAFSISSPLPPKVYIGRGATIDATASPREAIRSAETTNTAIDASREFTLSLKRTEKNTPMTTKVRM